MENDVSERGLRTRATNNAWQILLFVTAVAVTLSRRPDALFNAQFFAEDGTVWFADAYNLGVRSLLVPQAGYLHTLSRLVALSALLFPFSVAPLIMNLCAIAVQVLPVNMFLSKRFSLIPITYRMLGAFVYLLLPNSFEVDANVTTIQWHLALLACLVLFAEPAKCLAWQVFDLLILMLISVDGPMGILLVPVAGALWWKRYGDNWTRRLFFALIPGVILQTVTLLRFQGQRSGPPNGADLPRFIHILARQIFFSSLIGVKRENKIFMKVPFAIEIFVTVVGVLTIAYAVWHGPIAIKLFIAFASAVLAASLAFPLAAAIGPQWEVMSLPGVGNRYYFFSTIGFLSALIWIAADRSVPRKGIVRMAVVVLLLLLPTGIVTDWRVGPFVDLRFSSYARAFNQLPRGTHMIIPINPPGWTMELSKH